MNSNGETKPKKKVDLVVDSKGGSTTLTTTSVTDTGPTSPTMGEQTVVTYVTVPPDGGWGWVIVAASFACNFFVDGFIYSFGSFNKPLQDYLGENMVNVSLMGSLLTGFCLMSGPFASALANRYGFRVVAVAGALIACLGFTASYFFGSSVQMLWITYGIIGGLGFGLIYVPAVITTGFYFEKWRSIATGIAVCGSGIGTCTLAPLMDYLVKIHGCNKCFLIQAAMISSCALFGALFRPLLPIQVTVPGDEDDEDEELDEEEENNEEDNTEDHRLTVTSNKLPLLMKIRHAREELKRTDSKLSFDNEVSITAQPPKDIKRFLKAGHNMKYATVREVLNDSRETVQNLFNNGSNTSVEKAKEANKPIVRNKGRFDIITYKDKKINGFVHSNKSNGSNKSNDLGDFPDDSLLAKHLNGDTFTRKNAYKLAAAAKILQASDVRRNSISLRYHTARGRPRAYSESSSRGDGLHSRRATISAGVRPFYRDDIFFHANPSRLPQYSSTGSGLEYTMTVTRLPTFNDVLEEETAQCTLCPEAVQRTLATMLDISLLTSPTFLVLSISGFLTMMGFFVPYGYLKDRAKEGGLMESALTEWLIPTIGITNTLGRVGCGLVTSLPNINALLINNLSLSVAGIATMLSGFMLTSGYQFGYAAVFGIATSAFASLRSILIVDLIGLEKLTNGFGLLLLFQGVAAIMGNPIAGYFYDLTQSYDVMFFLSGALILLSGVICYPLNIINKWETERNARLERKEGVKDQAV